MKRATILLVLAGCASTPPQPIAPTASSYLVPADQPVATESTIQSTAAKDDTGEGDQREIFDADHPLYCVRKSGTAKNVCFVKIEECRATSQQLAGAGTPQPCDEQQFGACFRYSEVTSGRRRKLCEPTIDECERVIVSLRTTEDIKIDSKQCFVYRSSVAARPPEIVTSPASSPEQDERGWWCAEIQPPDGPVRASHCEPSKFKCRRAIETLNTNSPTEPQYGGCAKAAAVACFRGHMIVDDFDVDECFMWMRDCLSQQDFITKGPGKVDETLLSKCAPRH